MESNKKKNQPPHPRAKANPFSALTFSWTLPIFWSGLKKELEEHDLYEPLDEHSSGPLGDKFARLWEEEVARAGSKRTPSLLRVILRAYAARCMLYGFVLLVMECCIRIAQPVFLGKLVEYYSPGQNSVAKEEAYLYAALVILCSALNVFMVHPYMMAILHMGMKFRVACCSLIYRKSLRLSKTALGETTVGQVVNLLSNDVNRFDVAIIFLHYLWIGPLATVIITYFMWLEISWAAVVGVGVMLLFIPLQAYLGKRTSVLRLKTALRTDERVRLMNEILSGIQVIKMYTWEKPFADLVAKARKHEIKQIRSTSYIRGVLTSFIMFMTRICLYCSIIVYVLVHNNITAKQVFVITSFYNILRQTMTVFFPQGIAQVAEATISIKRLQNFMLYEDTSKPVPGLADIQTSVKPKIVEKEDSKELIKEKEKIAVPDEVPHEASQLRAETLEAELRGNGKVDLAPLESGEEDEQELSARVDQDARGVRLKHATAKWIVSHHENTLTDLSLTIKPGKLIAVIGPVGAGKSSLLHVLLRELPLQSGTLHVGGSVSYASQEPWLFAGSVRQNILFGQAMDRPRYNAVVRRCALDRDFQLFPQGDKTVVGERGVSLSGGQRARISLARSVYKRADIYLLDDPLSAVDAHVGRHLFESCLVGYLRNTTRILVTHQLQFLRDVDQIVILKNGAVAAAGNFETLSASGLDFASLLARDQEEEVKPAAEQPTADTEDSMLQGSFRKRQMSIHSVSSVDNLTATAPPESGRTETELRSAGAVSGAVYSAYLRASGPPLLVLCMLCVAVLSQVLGSGFDWWTGYWVNLEEENPSVLLSAMERSNLSGPIELATHYQEQLVSDVFYNSANISRYDCIYIYTGMVVALVVISLMRSFMFFSMAMRASTRLHNNMFQSITRAPMRFFHVNPSGRILNRFSKDMGAVDEVLPAALLDVLQIGLSLIGIVVVVAVVNYWLLVPTVAIGVVFYGLRIFYLSSSRSIKRLEGVTRSPVFSHLNATLQGITTIRAFGAQEALIREFDSHQDLHSSAWYLFIASSRAFGFWLDLVCVVYIALVTMSFLVMGEDEYGGNVGLAITQAMALTGMFQWGMRQSTELENQMTSVERIQEYSHIESEPPLQSAPDKKPPPSWPESGRLEFRHLFLYYTPGEPPVLKDLTLVIEPKEKVGIVGRTGAGKSSLINALFRLATVEGEIIIDGRETSTLGLHELRSQVSIIPQEPVLFSGTMRHNLDPFDEYPDQVLWRALEEVELKEAVMELPAGLSSRISEGGGNFSVGQRQLVCLARAIVRRNRLLVLDEATANVDPQTDALIQTTIRNKFADCTVLTIAHRLHTVMDSDKVLVMDAGQMVEFEHPHVLLQRAEGALRAMVERTGRSMAETLTRIAHQGYDKKHQPAPASSN
ncbi:ATP-binding cassette subfamily C member 4-like isoform X2 [Plodia interpunctella]|uniref:ATP-binding cassette subfamily C member 4-like isoform X2 n=1 Tax=Plodia interpunctella TaxID=58824 RepID=UPI002368CD3F|nr:ATP-binding cassette subfamily C member 4-like isoform X2 [Plodia interpunctella]XP_053601425.1 ATP-binding cassette subfamily C member 4-like isoform X2 [Plodia interpunctella]